MTTYINDSRERSGGPLWRRCARALIGIALSTTAGCATTYTHYPHGGFNVGPDEACDVMCQNDEHDRRWTSISGNMNDGTSYSTGVSRVWNVRHLQEVYRAVDQHGMATAAPIYPVPKEEVVAFLGKHCEHGVPDDLLEGYERGSTQLTFTEFNGSEDRFGAELIGPEGDVLQVVGCEGTFFGVEGIALVYLDVPDLYVEILEVRVRALIVRGWLESVVSLDPTTADRVEGEHYYFDADHFTWHPSGSRSVDAYRAYSDETFGGGASSPSEPTSETSGDAVRALREYKALLDEGVITQEEFDQKKSELLSGQ